MKFDDLIETIDMLSATQADEVIDWQLTDSPAAHMEGPTGGVYTHRDDFGSGLGPNWTISVRDGDGGIPLGCDSRVITELAMGSDFYVLAPEDIVIPSGYADEDICRRMPVTTISFRGLLDAPANMLGYAIVWCTSGGDGGNLHVEVSPELVESSTRYRRELGRREIYPGLVAVLVLTDGAVHAYVESFAPGGSH